MARVGVVLAGCGYLDGAAVQEAVFTLLALDRAGAEVQCFAPDVDQRKVVNHLTGDDTDERRNVLVESARIARGKIADVAQAKASDLDALILPGGFGAALNLCDFAVSGPDCTVHPGVAGLVKAVHEAGKPIGAICIAPALIAKVLGEEGVTVTIGTDQGVAQAIEAMGAVHEACPVDQMVADRERKVVTTPAYMLGPGPKDVAAGIERCVAEVLAMVG
ncbi:MAG: isoprenoid biosynthesis glyoxalase ElbB [Nitrospirota bacterium]|jgi:enhancing lycopene biosynthesis protein 2